MPVGFYESLRPTLKLQKRVCAPKPPQKRILDIATGDVTGVVLVVVGSKSHCSWKELLAQQYVGVSVGGEVCSSREREYGRQDEIVNC